MTMKPKIFATAPFNPRFNEYLPTPLQHDFIYQSEGLRKHIEKRHPECLPYLSFLFSIIEAPDYIGINPNEKGTSFELVKIMSENVQICRKLDIAEDYLYVATLHTITSGKLQHGIENGRLKKFDKSRISVYNVNIK